MLLKLQHDSVTRQLQPFIVVCITKISDRFCIVSACRQIFFCDISVILLFRLIGCLRGIGFCEVIQSVIFFCIAVLNEGEDLSVIDKFSVVCDTSYFFSCFIL